MKRRLRILIVFAGVLGLVMALNVGAASATNTGDPTAWTCDTGAVEINDGCGGNQTPDGVAADNALAPVGSHIADAGRTNGILPRGEDGTGTTIIGHNPLCPFHDAPET
jgi:hypothetical protein